MDAENNNRFHDSGTRTAVTDAVSQLPLKKVDHGKCRLRCGIALAVVIVLIIILGAVIPFVFVTQDVDECTDSSHNCDSNARCTNTDASFTCTCNTGFTGDGVTCTALLTMATVTVTLSPSLLPTTNSPAASDAFECGGGGDEFVGVNKKCNGAWDCSDGSDEYRCPNKITSSFLTYIECADKKGWIADYKKCNNIPDCFDGSDELGCLCSGSDYFHCLDRKGCFNKNKIHDGRVDCRDASDEGDHPIPGLPGNYTIKGASSVESRLTYLEAMRFCKSIGRIMLQLYSDEQVEKIIKYYGMDKDNRRYWIGAQDRNNNKVWTWNDGTNFTYTAWAKYNDDFKWDSTVPAYLRIIIGQGPRRPRVGQCAYLHNVNMYNQDCGLKDRVICMSEDAWVAPDKSIPCVYCTPGKLPPHGTISLLPANTTATGCPAGWSLVGSGCYKRGDSRVSKSAASAWCVQQGGKLPIVRTAAENTALEAWLPDGGGHWISLVLQGGVWRWGDGTPASYTAWGPGRPADGDCVFMNGYDGLWGDYSCTGSLPPLCQL